MAKVTIEQFRRSVGERVGLVKKWAAFEVWNRVTQKNPVDTGRSRAAWNLQIDRADLSVPAEGQSIAPPSPPSIGFVPAGVPIVVSNNLPYIGALESGHSRQAPNGFVQLSLDEVVNAADGAVAQIKARAEAGA